LAETITGPSTERFGLFGRELGVYWFCLCLKNGHGFYHNGCRFGKGRFYCGEIPYKDIPDDPAIMKSFIIRGRLGGFIPIDTLSGDSAYCLLGSVVS
jgi:hypothetical protein